MSNQISIKRGDTWQTTWAWRDEAGDPLDLTDCTAALQLRRQLGSAPALDLTSPSAQLAIDPATSDVSVAVDASTMATLAPGTYSCDMQMTFPDGRVISTATVAVSIETDVTQ